MRRWFHDRFNRHCWVNVSHRHDVEVDGEKFDYDLVECACGAIREAIIVKTELPFPIPGMTVGFAEVTINDLARLEDAKVWAEK